MSQQLDLPARSGVGTRARRPLWMLVLLAIGLGPLVARTLFDEPQAVLITQIVNALGFAESRPSIHLVRLAVRFLLPVCLALALLRFTPLGRWLVLTPFALAFLFVGDTLLVLNVVDQLRLFVLSGYPSFRFTGDFAAAVATLALGLATISLALATVWYRYDSSRRWMSRNGLRLFREA